MTRLTRAVELRDHAVRVLQAEGVWTEMPHRDGSVLRILEFRRNGITMSHRTPFQKVFAAPGASDKYMAALHKIDIKENLPYGLDIWDGRKVLNIEWDSHGNIDLVGLKRGDWENALEDLAATATAPCKTA